MYLDAQCLCSDDQALGDSAASTNVYDLGAAGIDIGTGEPLIAWAQITGDCETGDSVVVAVVGDSALPIDGSSVVLYQTMAVALSDLVTGYQFKLGTVPETDLRYLAFYYTCAGTTFDGTSAISAGFVIDRQTGEKATA